MEDLGLFYIVRGEVEFHFEGHDKFLKKGVLN